MNTDPRFALWLIGEALAVALILAAIVRETRLWRITAVIVTVAAFSLGVFIWKTSVVIA